MYTVKSLLAAAAAVASSALAAGPSVNVYFGQTGVDRLASYCDSTGFEYVTIGFVSASPEQDPETGYPTTNFGAHCAADVYENNGKPSHLLSKCTLMQEDIKYCKSKGKKVLLSVGGVWGSDPSHNYAVSSKANGEYFAKFLWKAFGPVDHTWNGPRPFDLSPQEPNILDGFDFDIELKFPDQTGYVAMINKLRSYITTEGRGQIITAAPQCPLADQWFQMKTTISQAKFDKLFIQYYNNPGCGADGSGFNYNDWEKFIAGTASKDAQLYIGLPADPSISGYITTAAANALVDKYKKKAHFGGIMLWDVARGKANSHEGKAFYEVIHELMYPAPPTPTKSHISTTSHTSTTSTTSTSSSYSSWPSSDVTTFSGSSYAVSPTASTSSSDSSWPSSDVTTFLGSSYATSSSTGSASAGHSLPPYPVSNTTSTYRPGTAGSSDASYSHPVTTKSHSDAGTSPSYSTATSSEDPTSHSYPTSTHSTHPESSTSEKAPSTTYQHKPTSTYIPTTDAQSTTYPVMTTSTVYSTRTYTITSCPPDVPKCPSRGSVTTEVVPWYTTVCPAAEETPYKPRPTYPVGIEAEYPAHEGGHDTYPEPTSTTRVTITQTSTIYKIRPTTYKPKPTTYKPKPTTYKPKPQPSAYPTYPAYNATTVPWPTKPGSAGSTDYAVGCSGAECHVVTAGAGRNLAACVVPVFLAAIALVGL